MNRLDEAAADNLAAYGIPPRRSQSRLEWVDLDLFYNGELGWRLGVPLEGENAKTFAAAVRGETGRDFDLRGVVRLAGTNWVQLRRTPAPAAVTGIPVNRRLTRLQILHGTEVRERDGVQIGTYVLHYADGRKEEIGIVYGEDVRDKRCCSPGDDGTTRATVAWTGENEAVKKWRADGSLRFYLRNWNNPVPRWRSRAWISSRR